MLPPREIAAVEYVVASEDERCPYLPDRVARMPLRLPLQPVTGEAFDARLEEGDRRAGPFLYRTACPRCTACEPLRIPVRDFRPTRSQRKVLARSERDLRVEVGPPRQSPLHLELFNRHKIERGLATTASSAADYKLQFLDSCTDTREVRYLVGDRLIAVSLLDVGARAASSVYHYFDPDESRRSPGVLSVLTEIALCDAWGLDWYYLGLYVAGCRSLRYKADYFPHERHIGGAWRRFDAPGP